MGEQIVVPAWKLGEPLEGFDPYSFNDAELRFRCLWEFEYGLSSPRFSAELVRDPNARDGEWLATVFHPCDALPIEPDSFEFGFQGVVPCWLPVPVALEVELRARVERLLVERIERAQVEWEAYWREVVAGMLGGER